MVMAKGRRKLGEMNQTEAEYAKLLEELRLSGNVAWWKFEAIKLKLAKNTTYTPDFFVMLSTGELQAHEIKGFWRDDARVKIKVAADIYPFKFVAVSKKTRKDGGGWRIEEF